MAYNDNIPAANDLISTSQGQIQANFQAIDSTSFGFGRNHVVLTDSTNGGLHKQVDYYLPIGDPSVAGISGSLYTKTVTNDELCFRNAVSISQLTNLTLVTTTPSATGFGFKTPWGITLNWGSIAVGAGGPTVGTAILFQVPFVSSLDSITATGINNNGTHGNVTVTGGSTTGCNLFSANNNTVYFFAIGH